MLSVVICTYNEEINLPRAVASVKSLADEIVVVDTESTDKTVEIAKKLGCKIYRHKNMGIIEPVRNFAISKAKGDWILLIDADEELSSGLISKLSDIKKNPQVDYYRIPRQNIIFGKWIKSAHWWPDYVYRMFKKNSLTWKNKIHSLPEINGNGIDLPADPDLAIVHNNYQNISQYLKKMDNYTDFQSQELISNGYPISWIDLLKKPASEFVSQYFAREGYKDGNHGLVLAILQAFSEFVIYTKIWQYHHFSQREIPLNNYISLQNEIANEFTWWQYEAKIRQSGFLQGIILKLKRKFL